MDKTEKIVSAIPSAAELEQLAELHKAMGDHTRMRILWHLTQKEYCVSDLAKEIGVTESALSPPTPCIADCSISPVTQRGKESNLFLAG